MTPPFFSQGIFLGLEFGCGPKAILLDLLQFASHTIIMAQKSKKSSEEKDSTTGKGKRSFAEIVGKIYDEKGKPVVIDEAVAQKIANLAIKKNNPALLKYIYKLVDEEKPDPELTSIKMAGERARTEKLEIANKRARGELIDRDYVRRVFGNIYSIHRSIFLPIGKTWAGAISAEMGINDEVKRLKIEEIITRESYQALSAIKREINDFLIANEGAPIEDEKEPAKKQVKKKKAPITKKKPGKKT